MKKFLKLSLLSLAVMIAGSAFAQNKALVRVAHLSPDAPNVDVWVGGNRVLEDVPFKAVSRFLEVDAGQYRVQVTPAGAETPVVIDANINVEANKAYTIAATGLLSANDLKPIVLVDDRTGEAQKAKIRFAHTSPDAPAVDIAVKNGPVVFGNVSFRESAGYASVDPGVYDLEVRLAGTSTVALAVNGVKLEANTNYTVFAAGLAGNGTLSALPVIDFGVTQIRAAHLSPDAPNVDIWINGARTLENVPYQAISDYLKLTAGAYRIQVSPAGANSPIVIDATVDFEANKAYTVAATGLLSAGDLQPIVLIDDRSPEAQKAKIRFVHTSADAPAVDIALKYGPVLFSNISFRQASNYLSVGAGSYDLEVRVAGTATVALSLDDVTLAAGTNYSVFAIGQLSNNTLSALPAVDYGMTQVRVGHLSPDAPAVDIWVNGERALQNVGYPAISDYLDLVAGSYRIQVTPAGANSPIVIDATVAFEANRAYTVAATGLLGANDLKPLVLVDDRDTESGKAKVRFVHTSPDAPAVDIAVKNGPTLFSNVSFRQSSDYLSVNPGAYDIEVRVAGTNTVALTAPNVTLGSNTNLSVFAIGLAGAGSLAALTAVDSRGGNPATFQLRVAHLSPDAPNVDIWIDGNRVLTDVPYLAVSDYLNLPEGEHRIQVSPAGATQPIVIDATVNFTGGKAYTVAATGLLGANDLHPVVLEDDRVPDAQNAKLRFVHTGADAPAVDIAVKNGPVLFSNIAFRSFGNYVAAPAGSYNLEVRVAGTNTVALELTGVALQNGKNYTVFATGLLSNGTLGALPVNDQFVTTALNDRLSAIPKQFELLQNYPNPFNPETKISYVLPNQSRVKLTVYDILGKEIARLVDGVQPEGSYAVLWNGRDANGMPAKTGVYFYRLEAENFKQTRKMTLIK